MIDIHCHIIPGVDDGSGSFSESVMMAKEAYKQGIRTIIATPLHHDQFVNPGQHIPAMVNQLNAKFKKERVDITVLSGQVTSIYSDLLDGIKIGDVLTLNEKSRHVLIDLPADHIPDYTTHLLYEMLITGLKPIIVNPELNYECRTNPNKLYQFVKNGALTQVAANSINGCNGKNVERFTRQLLNCGLTHFVASGSKGIKEKGFNMKDAYRKVAKEFGLMFSEQLRKNSESIISGSRIYKEQPIRIKPKSRFALFYY